MSTTLEVTDLATIKARISDQMAAHQASSAETRKELEDQQGKLATIRQNANGRRAHQAELQADMSKLQALLQERQTDAAAAVGTSLEAEKRASLEEIQDKVRETRDHLQLLQEAMEADAKAEANLSEQVQALVQRLEQLSSVQANLQMTYARFDAEHAAHVRELGLEALGKCDAEISRLLQEVEQAKEYRLQVQHKLAADLSFAPRIAEQTLIEVGTFEDPPIVQALQSRLNSLNALEGVHEIHPRVLGLLSGALPANLYRDYGGLKGFHEAQEAQRARNGSWIITNPAYQKFEMDMIALEGFLRAERDEWKREQARALLGILKPPVTAVVEVERVEPPLVVIE